MLPSEVVLDVLRRAGLSRAVLPAWLPGLLVVPTTALPEPLRRQRDELLAAVRRRVRYTRLAVTVQVLGLVVTWLGVVVRLPQVTTGGVVVAAVGAGLGLFGKDRLASLDSRTEQLASSYRGLLAEWLSMTLEVGPYSYALTGASGASVRDVLAERGPAVPPSAVDALTELLDSTTRPVPAATWSALRRDLLGLATLDEGGRTRRRRLELVFDSLHTLLLLLVVGVAVTTIAFAWPSAAIATVATLVVFGGRAAHDVTLTVPLGQPKAHSTTRTAQLAEWRRFCARPVADLSTTDVDTICDSVFLIRRGLRRRATRARIEQAFDHPSTATDRSV